MNEINAIILERRIGKKNVCIFSFFYMLSLLRDRHGGTPDLFIVVKEGEEDTTYYSQRLNVKSALSNDICTYLKFETLRQY